MASLSGITTSSTSIDVNSIVTQLMATEQKPLNRLDAQSTGYQAKLSAYGSLKSALASFQTTMSALTSGSSLLAMKATASDTGVLSATASASAVPGTYSIEVSQLAKQQKLVATGQASTTATLGTGAGDDGTGTLTFDFGTIEGALTNGKYDPDATTFTSSGTGMKTITIDSSHNSLAGIRDAINAAKIGVSATVVNDGDASLPYRLVLTPDTPGAASSMKITVTNEPAGKTALSDLLANDPEGTQNLSEMQSAQNAELKVDGLTVSKASNTVSDVVPGVTLNLSKQTSAAISLSVARDTVTAGSAAQSFVDAYNAIAKTVKPLISFDSSNNKLGVLQGDGIAMSLGGALRSMLAKAAVGAGSYTTLTPVGIGFQKDGTLALNATKFQAALASNPEDAAAVCRSYASSFNDYASKLLQSAGPISARTDDISSTLSHIANARDKETARLAAVEQAYRTQYAALDASLSSMNSTSTYLTQQLNNLPGFYSSNSRG